MRGVNVGSQENIRQRVHVQPKVHGPESLHSRRASKDRSPNLVRLRSDGELYKLELRQMAETTIQTPPLRKTTAQRRWIDKQDGRAKVLLRPGSTNGHQAHKHELLPGRFRRTQSDLRLSMVRSEPAENRLGTRVDRHDAVTPHYSKRQCSKTAVQPEHTQSTRS